MCGIVGYIGNEQRAMDVLVDGLRRLEYRGYDSAGVAIFRTTARIAVLPRHGKAREPGEHVLRDAPLSRARSASATRAGPRTGSRRSETRTRTESASSVVIVHNGIIENYRELRVELETPRVARFSPTPTPSWSRT